MKVQSLLAPLEIPEGSFLGSDYYLLVDINTIKALTSKSGPVLITGHTGFKGVWLTLLLENLDIPVIGFSLPAEKDSLYALLNREGRIKESFADIRESTELSNFINSHKPSIIIHLAAQALVLNSYSEPKITFGTNVMGTVNLLEAAFSNTAVKVVCVITTDKVYENKETGSRFSENDSLKGKDPYSASKVATEAVCEAWKQIQKISGGPRIVVARAGNVIGGGDSAPNRLLPDLVKSLLSQEKALIRNPKSTRPWQHVLDPLLGYILAIEKSLQNKENLTYNFGPNERSLSVEDVVKTALKFWPGHAQVEFLENPHFSVPHEAQSLELDSTLARDQISWRPAFSQETSVEHTISWWSKIHYKGISPNKACEEDIQEFLKILGVSG